MKYNSDVTRERLVQLLTYCPDTGLFHWLVSRGRTKAGNIAGTKRKDGYIIIRIDKINYLAHRLAFFFMTGGWPTNEIDHENLTPSDNRWEEIRPATPSQNGCNKRAQRNNKLGLKGVRLRCAGNYQATIFLNGKQKHLGLFDTKELAAAAYAKAANEHFGEFARIA